MDPIQILKKYGWLVVVGVILLSIISAVSNTKTQNRFYENQANAIYASCQTELSTYMVAFNDKFSIMNFNAATVHSVITDAVTGRYDQLGNDGLPTGSIDAGLLVNAIMVSEAYPDTSALTAFAQEFSIWDASRREDFGNCQKSLISNFQSWDTFNSGLVQEPLSAAMGFPDEKLTTGGKNPLFGQAAREKMLELVLYKGARDAYESGDLLDNPIPTPMIQP